MSKNKSFLSKLSYKWKLTKGMLNRAIVFRDKAKTKEQREAWNEVIVWLNSFLNPKFRIFTKSGAIGLNIKNSDIPKILNDISIVTDEEHIISLVRHIRNVQDAGRYLGMKLINQDEKQLGNWLIQACFTHDNSKFSGIEWRYIRSDKGGNKKEFYKSLERHRKSNAHHPEFWEDVNKMSEVSIAEMVCDWYARSCEQGTDFLEWIEKQCLEEFPINKDTHKKIKRFAYMLLEKKLI